MRYFIKSVVSIFLLLSLHDVLAQDSDEDGLLKQAQSLGLSNSDKWLKLLHFHKNELSFHLKSEVDDPKFFINEQGKTNADAELNSTIKLFIAKPISICQYPARYTWLKTKLDLNLGTSLKECKNFQSWRNQVSGDKLTLIFPGSFLNNPSSMFGHLFFRLDSTDTEYRSDLLSTTINYGANVPESDPGYAFAYKGLTGNYSGTVSIQPYYEQVKKYSDVENRDIWEYSLTLSAEEVSFFLMHVWELKHIKFDYFFFDENCAYRLLTLIDVVRPELNLSDEFNLYAIPADVARKILAANLVGSIKYRPALHSRLTSAHQKLSKKSKKLFANIKDKAYDAKQWQTITTLTEIEQARFYNTFAHYAQLRIVKLKNQETRKRYSKIAYQALTELSKLKLQESDAKVVERKWREDQGHRSSMSSIGFKSTEEEDFFEFRIRPAYHSITDPPQGYLPGAQIRFLETALAIDDSSIKVNEFTLLNILSLSPITALREPISWGVDLSFNRLYLKDNEYKSYNLSAKAGGSLQLNESNLVYLLGSIHNLYESKIINKNSINIGLEAGLLTNFSQMQWLWSAKIADNFSGFNTDIKNYSMTATYNLSENLALQFKAEHLDYFEEQDNQVSLNLRYFY